MVDMKPQSFRVIEGDGGASKAETQNPEHLGAFLREARVSTGGNLADIAVALNIRPKFLQAIEDGRYEDLPGSTYAAGFIRSYADYLGLDAELLLARFREESLAAEAGPDLDFPAPSTVGWFPTGKVVASCAILAAAVFGGWYFLQSGKSIEVATVPEPPGYEPGADVAAAANKPADMADTGSAAASGLSPLAVTAGATSPDVTAAETAVPGDDEPAEVAGSSEAAAGTAEQNGSALEPITALATPQPAVEANEPQPEEPAQPAQAGAPAPAQEPDATPAPAAADSVETPAPAAETTAPEENKPAPSVVNTPEPASEPASGPVLRLPERPLPAAELPVIPADDSAASTTDESGRVFGADNEQARVVIGAKDDSWVQVLDEEQNVVLTRLLRAGDRYLVPNRSDLVMLTGNAGGLIISVDGETVPQIGSDGAILHNVRLDADALKAGRAVIR